MHITADYILSPPYPYPHQPLPVTHTGFKSLVEHYSPSSPLLVDVDNWKRPVPSERATMGNA